LGEKIIFIAYTLQSTVFMNAILIGNHNSQKLLNNMIIKKLCPLSSGFRVYCVYWNVEVN